MTYSREQAKVLLSRHLAAAYIGVKPQTLAVWASTVRALVAERQLGVHFWQQRVRGVVIIHAGFHARRRSRQHRLALGPQLQRPRA